MTQLFLPDLPGFSLEQVTLEGGMITVLAHSQPPTAPCPVCNQVSSRVHGRYTRHLADLPSSGRTVRLAVQVRRFFCLRPTCSRQTFAEALPALAERHTGRTTRLTDLLLKIGLALGGEAGVRFTSVLSVPCSPDTLLRTIRRSPLPPIEPPRSIGIDDWAWRTGHRYGTFICDLERHHVIDLLPDRNATSVADWLKRYPSIEVISRDRSDIYAQGARLGVPQAIQVADKWHLLKNLGEVVQRLLTRHLIVHRKHQQGVREPQQPALPETRSPHLSKQQESIVQMHRENRLDLYHQVVALHKQGMSHQAIATLVGMGHSTVSRSIAAETFPERKRREQASHLSAWLEAGASSSLTPFQPFCAGISQDKAAVQAGLTRPESQGQTEGQVTRLKLIKRQGYGRAHFDLLRQRVLHAA